MRWRWASVSVTLLAVVDDAACGASAASGEQPANDRIAIAITRNANARGPLPWRSWGGIPPRELLFIFDLNQIGAMPPAATERLKQRRRIGVTIGLCLHEVDAR